MKQKFLFKTMLLLCALIAGNGSAWADTYSLATSLSVDDQVVLVNNDVTKELNGITTTGTTYGTVANVSNQTPAGIYPLTIVAGSTDGSFAFKTSNNEYLSWSSGNSLTTSSSVTNASSWTVSISNTGEATITNVGTTSRKLQYNSGNPRFACYSSNQQKVKLYKQEGGSTLEDPDLALTGAPVELSFDLNGNDTPQVINYTTSSTGAVTVSSSDYITTEVNESAKTITVTPTAVTPSAQTITVSQAADDTYKLGTATFTVTITDSTPDPYIWVETPITGLTASDVFVIVGNNNGNTFYAMTNDNGSSAPQAPTVTISDNKITSPVSNNYKWNISGNGTDGYTFYPNGSTDYLYCNTTASSSSNDNMRVGSNGSRKLFVMDSDHLKTIDNYTTRYVSVYTSGPNWRGYTTASTTVKFYKRFEVSPLSSIALSGDYPLTFHVGDEFSHEGMTVTATYESGQTADVTASATCSGYNMSETGEQTVTVSYTESEVTKTATYAITVNAPATLESITLSGTYPTEFEQGDAFSSEGIVVTANYDDNTTSDVTAEATFSGYDMATLGEQTVIVTYGGQTASYTINVEEKKGTSTRPYTVAEALAASVSTSVYVRGIVSSIVSTDLTNSGQIRYYISDDGTTSSEMNIYNGLGINGAAFTSINDIQVGDEVVITGDISVHSNANQLSANNQLVSLKLVKPTFSVAAGAVASGTEVTISDLHTDATIYYTTDGTEPTEGSTEYTGAITITAEQTIKAIAVKSGYTTSNVAEAAYTINLTPEITITAANPVNVIADGGSGELALAYENLTISDVNDFAVQFYDENDDEISDPNWIGVAVEDADPSGYKVSYVVLANNGDARTAYFKVWALDGSTPIYSNKVTVTQAAPVEYVALVAQYDGKFYAVNKSFSNKTFSATEVDAVNGKVVNGEGDDISWIISTDNDGATIVNKDGYTYIGYSGNDLNTSSTNKWTVDETNASWKNGTSGTRSIVYRNGYGFRSYATSNIGNSGYATSYTTAYAFADGYTREVTAGNYGTICLPYDVAAEDFSGVKFYSISGKKMDDTTLEYVTLQEEDELVAGVAYIFKANEEATKLVAAYSGKEETEPIGAHDSETGLTGTYSKQYIPKGMYVLKGGTIYYVDKADYVYSGANKAYIDLTDVPEVGASAVKGICLFGEDFETGIMSVDGSQEFNETYNLAGQRIQKAQRGVNIVNGKKVLY